MTDLFPPDFAFSQSNLQTFSYCRRRFYLRYIRKLIWPDQVVSDQQYAQDRDAGVRFHRLVHQYFLGFDNALLRKVAEADPDPRISDWLEAFFISPVSRLEGKLYPEALYTTIIADHPLNAKVDLLQIEDDAVRIFDWKTSRQLPKIASLQRQAQSKVYPLVVSNVFRKLPDGNPIENLTMVYWEANFPDQEIEINSSPPDWQKYEVEITTLIDTILSLSAEEFVLTPDQRKCAWCEYRSYCHRREEKTASDEFQQELLDDKRKVPEDVIDLWGAV